jgi:hypothetical protein
VEQEVRESAGGDRGARKQEEAGPTEARPRDQQAGRSEHGGYRGTCGRDGEVLELGIIVVREVAVSERVPAPDNEEGGESEHRQRGSDTQREFEAAAEADTLQLSVLIVVH